MRQHCQLPWPLRSIGATSCQRSGVRFQRSGFRFKSPFRFSVFQLFSVSLQVDLVGSRHTLKKLMINVTDNAVRQLRSLLEAQPASAQKGLRVQIAKGGCSGLQYEMALDEKRPGDSVVERDGVHFLVDEESAALLQGATLDFHEGLTGVGFHIVNPNASRTCGCGSSFEAARPT
jgi:iron-sulfur cluster assembly accessory protein